MSTFYFAFDPYFNPQLNLPSKDAMKAAQVEAALADIRFPVERSSALKAALAEELALGLQKSPKRPSAFPMFNTMATGAHFPTGAELGNFLAIDIGGTNLRVMVLRLFKDPKTGQTKQEIEVDFYEAPDEVRKSNSERFFGFLATSILDFVEKHGLRNNSDPSYKVPLGFTFSFGYDQLAIDKGSVVQFGIETNIPDAIGRDPVELLQKSLNSIQAPVQVVALANDVTATLIYAKYLKPDATVSLILGSGTNVGYIEKLANFGRIAGKSQEVFGVSDVQELIINTELGFFGDRGEMDAWISRFEKKVDASSFLPSVYVYEKCAGAAFMGEHLRFILLGLIEEEKLLLGGRVSKELTSKNVLSAKDLSEIEEAYLKKDEDHGAGYKKVITDLFNRLGYPTNEITEDDIEIVRLIVQLITIRVATFAAAEVAIFVDHLAQLPVVKVGVDGSLFRKHPKMATLLKIILEQMCPGRKVELFDAEEGSSIGAALLAAVVVNQKNK